MGLGNAGLRGWGRPPERRQARAVVVKVSRIGAYVKGRLPVKLDASCLHNHEPSGAADKTPRSRKLHQFGETSRTPTTETYQQHRAAGRTTRPPPLTSQRLNHCSLFVIAKL